MESRLKPLYDRSPVFVQNLLLSAFSGVLHRERYGGRFARFKEFLAQSQWYSDRQLADYQQETLAGLISYSYQHVPYYRRIMDERGLRPQDITTPDELVKLPVLTRKDLKEHFHELLSDEYRLTSVKKGHTSGTTGSPLEICYSDDLIHMNYAMLDRQYCWAGINFRRFGDRIAVARGNVIVPLHQRKPPFWRHNYYHNHLLLSSFHLTRENLAFYLDELERFRPRVLDGYPSTVYVLAKHLRNSGRKLPLDAVLTSSETLFDFQREVIEDSFQCRIFDYFGAAERVLFATECEKHEGHHLAMEYGITEVVDDNHQPLGPDRFGHLVATSLHNRAMPLIRYLTNDMSAIRSNRCSCGRRLVLMDDVTTKAEDILTLRDGRLISPSVLTHPFKPLTSIEASQIIQEDLDTLCVRLVTGSAFTEQDGDRLVHGLQERLGEQVRIRIEVVPELERTRTGKFKWVISHVATGI
jgi:phenylacetate-CoA ligase